MATRPELHIAVAKTKSKASDYNDNFDMMMDYIESSMDEFMPAITGQNGKVLTTNGSTTSWTNAPVALLQTIYPIGSIYIGTMSTCPMAAFFGTWELKSSGRVLQGADDDHEVGTTIAAGLPNITGYAGCRRNGESNLGVTTGGAFYITGGNEARSGSNADGPPNAIYNFDASRSSSIYGESNTVQPPAYVVNIWERVA